MLQVVDQQTDGGSEHVNGLGIAKGLAMQAC